MRKGVSTAALTVLAAAVMSGAVMSGAAVAPAEGPTTGPLVAPADAPAATPATAPLVAASAWSKAVEDEQLLVRNGLDVRPFLTKLRADHGKEIDKSDLGGDAEAAFLEYEFDRRGIGKPADLPGSASSLKVAANRGCPAAMIGMSDALRCGFETTANDAAALNWAQRAAAAGNTDGRVLLSTYVKQGVGIKPDVGAAFKEAGAAAAAGNSSGVVEVALDTLQGQGTTADTEAGLTELRQAAGMGNARAMVLLGGLYQAGGGHVKQDRTAAFTWFTKAADAGCVNGLIQEAVCHEQGWGVAKDSAKALELLKRAADTGDPAAILVYESFAESEKKITPEQATDLVRTAVDHGSVDGIKALGDRYCTGDGVKQDQSRGATLYAQAVNAGSGPAALAAGILYGSVPSPHAASDAVYWFSRGAELRDFPSLYLLGKCYAKGAGVPADPKAAFALLAAAAGGGYGPAEISLGDALLAGSGAPADPEAAFKWYSQAAAHGYTDANIRLAGMYVNGQGTPKDLEKAITQMQFDQRTRGQAMSLLGFLLLQGQGVTKDTKTGFDLCKKSADLGEPAGMNNLASCYEDGVGTTADQNLAAEWYRKAAAAGWGPAMDSLGTMSAQGRGVAKDAKAAVDWYRKAADAGCAPGAGHLAQMLVTGAGVPADPDGAIKAGERAADLGDVSVLANLYGEFANGNGGVTKDPGRALACSDKLAARNYRIRVEQPTTGPTSGPTKK
jgi:TPR repeat protein